jgi:hypothetical protein
MQDEPFNDVRVQDVYKKMDSSLEGFFYKRNFSLKNFNFLLQILAEQKKLSESIKALEKMKVKNNSKSKELGLSPDKTTFNFLIKACAKVNDSD